MNDLKDAVVLVLGLGQSGLAMARWSARCGATVRVWDSRDEPPHAAALAEHVPQAQRLSGELAESALDGVTRVLKSPGLAPDDARIAPTLRRARERAIAVQGELDLFARALAELKAERGYAPKVLAVTGTNGKTTTTALAAMLIERAGRRVVAAGNIGPTMLETLADALQLEGDARRDEPGLDDELSGAVEDDLAQAGAADDQAPVAADDAADVASDIASDLAPGVASEGASEATSDVDVDSPQDLQTQADAQARLDAEQDARADAASAAAARDGSVDTLAVEPIGDEPAALLTDAPQSVETEPAAEAEASVDTTADAYTSIDAPVRAPALPGDDEPAPILPDPDPPPPVFEHLPEVWVLELSSFQLDGVVSFEPTAAAVLNITQDHLDWHGSMPAYTAAKARIFGAHGVMVINRDDPAVEALIPPPTIVKGARGRPARSIEREVVRFGLSAPTRPGDFGLLDEGGMTWLVRARELDETMRGKPARGARAAAAAEPDELHIQRLMPADALRLRGRHNASNALAALALATVAGCPLAPMLHGLREYEGEPHRVQYVATLNGVDAFDDSKGTNVGATVAAILGLGADRAPAQIVVILGGDGKGQDFAPLLAPVRRHVRAVATIGRDAARIEEAIAASGVAMQRHDTLEAATGWSFEQAQPGDAVLLSPACASLDMFRNYAHRAEVFVRAVHARVADVGGVA